MMSTQLVRASVRGLYRSAKKDSSLDAHLGLLLQRGMTEYRDDDTESKAKLIDLLSRRAVSDSYERAYKRWTESTADESRFRAVRMALERRLFVGLATGGTLETGCAISHSYGAPYIPGSSVKGVVSGYARGRLSEEGRAICDELFGAPQSERHPVGLSGLIIFHDAWWVPGSRSCPLVREIVTTHHPDYYSHEGAVPASDFDSPVPNPQIAVSGDFYFVLEGPPAWLDLSAQMMESALSVRGLGAKTRSGYGIFASRAGAQAQERCEWVDKTITELGDRHRMQSASAVLRSKVLAVAWSEIVDPKLKEEAFLDIRARAREAGWWDNAASHSRSTKRAKAIYDNYSSSADSTVEGSGS